MDKLKQLGNSLQPKAGNPRLMRFPYTLGAQVALFPYKFYFQNQWIFRYWIYGCVCCLPLFAWISKQVNTDANKAKWKEIRRKELLETHYYNDPEAELHGGHH